jgi:hypothetical protein
MTTTNTTSKRNLTSVKLFVLFVFMFLSTSTVFGQETKETVSIVEPTTELISSENSIATTTTEFAVWFVGSNKASQTKTGTLSFGRKQLINSGITTNKVLIKVVLKKIVGQDSSIA